MFGRFNQSEMLALLRKYFTIENISPSGIPSLGKIIL